MASTAVPPPPPPTAVVPERRVPVVPRLADDGGGGGSGGRGDARGSGSGSVAGISPSILIIAVIVVVMLLASVAIHYFIRHLCRHVGPSGQAAAPPLPLVARPAAGSASSAAVAPAEQGGGGGGKSAAAEEAEAERLISRLPLFTLASSLAAVPKSSRDCAVCQSAFRDDDQLRLLPACRHAFHARCVDPWLRGNPSCPLCRASIALPHPPLTELLRVELGSVSSRRSNPDAAAVSAYPLPSLPAGADSEYLVGEEVHVVLKPSPPAGSSEPAPAQPQRQLAAVERGQPSSAAASVGVTPTASFRSAERSSSRWSNRWSSRWTSGRWSSRYDAGTVTAAATAEWWWDMDGGAAPAAPRRREAEENSASFYGFLRWLTGAY